MARNNSYPAEVWTRDRLTDCVQHMQCTGGNVDVIVKDGDGESHNGGHVLPLPLGGRIGRIIRKASLG